MTPTNTPGKGIPDARAEFFALVPRTAKAKRLHSTLTLYLNAGDITPERALREARMAGITR